MGHSSKSASCFAWLFILIWCVGVLVFDTAIGWGVYQNALTYAYAETTGTITRSQLIRGPGRKASQTLEVAYQYTVEGQQLTGTQYRRHMVRTNDRTWTNLHAELPVGKTVPVFYDANNPREAVLHRGLMGLDLFLLWFLTPFNIIAWFGFLYLLRGSPSSFIPDDPRIIRMTDTGWQFRPYGLDWRPTAGATLFGCTFFGMFLIAFCIGMNPSLIFMALAWLAAMLLSCWVATRHTRKIAMEYDDFQKEIIIAPSGNARTVIPLNLFRGCTVDREVKETDEGTQFTYHIAMRWGREGQMTRLHQCTEPEEAESISQWLEKAITMPGGVHVESQAEEGASGIE